MKWRLLGALCLLFVSSLAFAQAGSIGIFEDTGGVDCDILDTPGLVNVYVVHLYSPGSTAAQFKVYWDAGMLMMYLSEAVTPPYIGIGTSTSGIAIAYGGCYPSPNMILTISFFGQGLSAQCSRMYVIEDPSATPPGIYVTDCADPPNLLTGNGMDAVVNDDGSCSCKIPVEQTSWGQIKSMYK